MDTDKKDSEKKVKEGIDMATIMNESRRLVCIPADKSGRFVRDFNKNVASKEAKANWKIAARLFNREK